VRQLAPIITLSLTGMMLLRCILPFAFALHWDSAASNNIDGSLKDTYPSSGIWIIETDVAFPRASQEERKTTHPFLQNMLINYIIALKLLNELEVLESVNLLAHSPTQTGTLSASQATISGNAHISNALDTAEIYSLSREQPEL